MSAARRRGAGGGEGGGRGKPRGKGPKRPSPPRGDGRDSRSGPSRGSDRDSRSNAPRGDDRESRRGPARGGERDSRPGPSRGSGRDSRPGPSGGGGRATRPNAPRGSARDSRPNAPRGGDRDSRPGPPRGGDRDAGRPARRPTPRPDREPADARPAPAHEIPAVDGPIVVYGRNAVHEALRAGRRRVHRIWATSGAAREPWLAKAAARVDVVETEEVERHAGSDGHQGVCALVDPYPYADAAELLRRPAPLIVALDEVQDPQNLGAIIRTAEAAGADGVVICERRAAQVTAAVSKASAGAVEHLPVARVRNLADFLAEAKAAECWCYGAASEGAVPYTDPDWTGGVVLVLGSEGHGLRPRVAAACDALVALPLHGRVASLNVSAAAAALLYGILQRRTSA
jgi:23S rRNA (guanosine2251-2'-O)-methyltransferase